MSLEVVYQTSSETTLLKIPVSVLLVFFSIVGFLLEQERHAFSQSFKSVATTAVTETAMPRVDLVNIHTLPANVKDRNTFEIASTVVNNSPNKIMFIAGVCDSPLFATFIKNVVIKHTQGCLTPSPFFKLKQGEQVSVAGPSSGITYQAFTAGQTTASITRHYMVLYGI